jgi:hypothetical protein
VECVTRVGTFPPTFQEFLLLWHVRIRVMAYIPAWAVQSDNLEKPSFPLGMVLPPSDNLPHFPLPPHDPRSNYGAYYSNGVLALPSSTLPPHPVSHSGMQPPPSSNLPQPVPNQHGLPPGYLLVPVNMGQDNPQLPAQHQAYLNAQPTLIGHYPAPFPAGFNATSSTVLSAAGSPAVFNATATTDSRGGFSNGANAPPFAPARQPKDNGPKQLIVNFLDENVTNAELHAAFSSIGPLDAARVIYDKASSKSKGFGFVYFKHSRDAATAMQCMTGHPMRSKHIKVSYASPQRSYTSDA